MKKGFILTVIVAATTSLAVAQNKQTYTFTQKPYFVDVPQTEVDKQFLNFVDFYNKTYSSLNDFQFRREVYKRNIKLIQLSQSRVANGGNLKLGTTRFADQTPQEIQSIMKYKPVPVKQDTVKFEDQESQVNEVPAYWDWRKFGMVSPVKDQQGCGASWAYAAASAIESRWKNISEEMVDLSVQ